MPCKKCGSEAITVEWHDKYEPPKIDYALPCVVRLSCNDNNEHLHYSCKNCGFDWTGPVKEVEELSCNDCRHRENRGAIKYKLGDELNCRELGLVFYRLKETCCLWNKENTGFGETVTTTMVINKAFALSFDYGCFCAGKDVSFENRIEGIKTFIDHNLASFLITKRDKGKKELIDFLTEGDCYIPEDPYPHLARQNKANMASRISVGLASYKEAAMFHKGYIAGDKLVHMSTGKAFFIDGNGDLQEWKED